MSTAAQTQPRAATPLLTAEEFGARPDPGYPEELVEGRIIAISPPRSRYGQICNRVGRILGNFADDHDLGHVLSNDSGVVTRRDPDSVRGADIAFYSYNRVPRGPLPPGYLPQVPELVVEVLSPGDSPGDRWPHILAKTSEYVTAGVVVVLLLDDDHRAARVFRADAPPVRLGSEDSLSFPDLLPGFEVKVAAFFG